MNLQDILLAINGRIICGENRLSEEFNYAFASDLMSDVLTIQIANFILITGLVNVQTLRSAEMADINCVIIVRNKKTPSDFIELAKQNNITLIECSYSMFKTCGILYNIGLKAVY
jgi:hypothetical protein